MGLGFDIVLDHSLFQHQILLHLAHTYIEHSAFGAKSVVVAIRRSIVFLTVRLDERELRPTHHL
jgi:hypothetical protein